MRIQHDGRPIGTWLEMHGYAPKPFPYVIACFLHVSFLSVTLIYLPAYHTLPALQLIHCQDTCPIVMPDVTGYIVDSSVSAIAIMMQCSQAMFSVVVSGLLKVFVT